MLTPVKLIIVRFLLRTPKMSDGITHPPIGFLQRIGPVHYESIALAVEIGDHVLHLLQD